MGKVETNSRTRRYVLKGEARRRLNSYLVPVSLFHIMLLVKPLVVSAFLYVRWVNLGNVFDSHGRR